MRISGQLINPFPRRTASKYWHLRDVPGAVILRFLHDRPWISLWIKSIPNELDITIHVIASQLSRYCDIISNRLWRHQQNEDWASETQGRCVKIVILSSFIDVLCHVRNIIMYVLSWRTVSALTWVLFLCLSNKHKNNLLVSTETVCHSSTCTLFSMYNLWTHHTELTSCSFAVKLLSRYYCLMNEKPTLTHWSLGDFNDLLDE